ncbi:MAG: inositol monophosphatase family protein [Candidatus Hydrogenedentes bacterium]|nr:inositol monophosphatase family protein [Candidatus Hydrogenedentota bacterium]
MAKSDALRERSRAATAISRPSLVTPGRPANPRAKILPREFLFEVANAVRIAVEPLVRQAKGREVVGLAQSGDTTFQLDKIAEKALLTFLREAKMPVAYYSEDAGYATFTTGQPQHLLVVDPIDGSRAAKSGFEGCVISVASTRVIERPRIIDIDNGCVMEILHPRTFYAERGKGARIYADGAVKKPKLSRNTNLETVSWAMTVPARPAELIFPTAAKLIDLTSLKGGFFACNSTSYSLTRLLTCQYDACIDFANRFLRDIPNIVQDHFINAGRGAVLGIAPYDIAASLLIAREAGCYVTDAYGNTLDDVMLLDSSVANHRSIIAASSKELYEKLFSFFDLRIKQFELLLQRRAQPNG